MKQDLPAIPEEDSAQDLGLPRGLGNLPPPRRAARRSKRCVRDCRGAGGRVTRAKLRFDAPADALLEHSWTPEELRALLEAGTRPVALSDLRLACRDGGGCGPAATATHTYLMRLSAPPLDCRRMGREIEDLKKRLEETEASLEDYKKLYEATVASKASAVANKAAEVAAAQAEVAAAQAEVAALREALRRQEGIVADLRRQLETERAGSGSLDMSLGRASP